ncbi:TBL2 protein, partial [Pheucticus melanocephalus]|nr:TBL2 protein [Pheucticus melanocephalus]
RARREKPHQHSFAHRLLVAALKGHSSPVTCLDFSSNGKYLASCSEDRTVRLWSTRDLAGREHRCLRANLGLDHAELVRLSPDSRAFIVWLANAETIRVYKMTKKDDGSLTFTATSGDFPKKHKAPVINIGIAETERLGCEGGEALPQVAQRRCGCPIPGSVQGCVARGLEQPGLVVGFFAFEKEQRLYLCIDSHFRRDHSPQRIPGSWTGQGKRCHPFSMHSLCSLCCRMATVSKDGTWKFWDTDVEYKKQQDPHLLLTGQCAVLEPCRIALSPDGRTVAVASGTDIVVYNTRRGEEEERFLGVHSHCITDLVFDTTGRYVVSCGDRAICVLHNTAGHRAVVEEMEAMLKKTGNKATQERLEQQISSARKALAAIYGKKH